MYTGLNKVSHMGHGEPAEPCAWKSHKVTPALVETCIHYNGQRPATLETGLVDPIQHMYSHTRGHAFLVL